MPAKCSEEKIRAKIRMLKGADLLQEILSLEVFSVATVPVSRIVEFRKKNGDLLESFLTRYRGFRMEVQNELGKVDQVRAARADDRQGAGQDQARDCGSASSSEFRLAQETQGRGLRGQKGDGDANLMGNARSPGILAAVASSLWALSSKLFDSAIDEQEASTRCSLRAAAGICGKQARSFGQTRRAECLY